MAKTEDLHRVFHRLRNAEFRRLLAERRPWNRPDRFQRCQAFNMAWDDADHNVRVQLGLGDPAESDVAAGHEDAADGQGGTVDARQGAGA